MPLLSPYLDVLRHVDISRPVSDKETSALEVNRRRLWSPHRHLACLPATLYTVNCLVSQSSAIGPYIRTKQGI